MSVLLTPKHANQTSCVSHAGRNESATADEPERHGFSISTNRTGRYFESIQSETFPQIRAGPHATHKPKSAINEANIPVLGCR